MLSDGGRAVSIGTAGADATSVTFPGVADYCATKAAIATSAKGWARELGPRRITVNVVQPGLIETDMNLSDAPGLPPWPGQQRSEGRGARGRTAAAAFLARPDSSYVTGTALPVGSGLSARSRGPAEGKRSQPRLEVP